ncbi:Glutamine synthetase type I (EC 6.3.1.2) [Azospirillum melinis]
MYLPGVPAGADYAVKWEKSNDFRTMPHPIEYKMYYSV